MREAIREVLSDSFVREDSSLCPLAKDLLSLNTEVANAAIRKAWELAESGNRQSVEALEQAIRFRHNAFSHNGTNCRFYQPGVRVADARKMLQDMRGAYNRIVELAAHGHLWLTPPYEIQELLSVCSGISDWEDLLKDVESKASKDQAHALLLLATHLQVRKLLGDIG